MLANYHTHTCWCRHATGEAEDYIKEAIRLGLKEIAITDHVPHPGNADPNRMRWEEFEGFNQKLDEAITCYGDQIRILKGFECEYYPEEMSIYREFKEKYHYDVLILGQHRCGQKREIDCFSAIDVQGIEIYAETVCAGLKTGLFRFLAHPDVFLCGYGKWDRHCEKALRKIYQVCEEYKIPIEINGTGFRRQRPYPSRQALELSKEYRLSYLINADAHHPEHLCDETMVRLEEKIREMGLPVLSFLPEPSK